jgi:peptide/nickel transport system permease protein
MLTRRLVAAAGTLLAVSVILFAASEVTPGDAATASLGANATPDQVAALRAAWGLDRPLPQRYAAWVGSLRHGHLGTSLATGRPVADLVAEPFAYTALLVLLAGTATVVLAGTVGVLAGRHPGSRLDRALTGAAVTVVAIPQFVVAVLLVLLFAALLHILPAVSLVPFGGNPLDQPSILVLPVLALVLPAAAWASRLVRAVVVDANAAPHAEAARLAGLAEHTVMFRHVLPATVGPCAQVFAWLVSALFGGTAVVEQVFNYPGLSGVLLDAVRHHDPAVLEGVGLLLACLVVGAILLADVVGVLADPKLRRLRRAD